MSFDELETDLVFQNVLSEFIAYHQTPRKNRKMQEGFEISRCYMQSVFDALKQARIQKTSEWLASKINLKDLTLHPSIEDYAMEFYPTEGFDEVHLGCPIDAMYECVQRLIEREQAYGLELPSLLEKAKKMIR